MTPGTRLTLRHTVFDVQVPDDQIPYAAFTLATATKNVILSPGAGMMAPYLGQATYDPNGPRGDTGVLDFRFDFTLPDPLSLIDAQGAVTSEPAAGQVLTVLGFYTDGFDPRSSMAAFTQRVDLIHVTAP